MSRNTQFLQRLVTGPVSGPDMANNVVEHSSISLCRTGFFFKPVIVITMAQALPQIQHKKARKCIAPVLFYMAYLMPQPWRVLQKLSCGYPM